MYILRVEHAVPNYDGWKKAFDSDPIGREKLGVRSYGVLRLVENPNHVLIDLEFDTRSEADSALVALHTLWGKLQGKFVLEHQARIAEVAESKAFPGTVRR